VRTRWIFFGALSIAAGFAYGLIFPRSWGFMAPYGLLLGAAVYILGFLRRSFLRAGLFLAMTALLLYLRYGTREQMDLTWPLATLASWSLVESWLGRNGVERASGREAGNS
jgi:hypothetical protein